MRGDFYKIKIKFLCIVICILFLAIFSGCDRGIETVRFEFEQYPRLIYVANVDTELDFSEATIFNTQRDGLQEDALPLVLGDWVAIEHSIDFATPGYYEVKIVLHLRGGQFPIMFTIQVVDEETYNMLNRAQ